MDAHALISELQFKAVRSSGPGGQNVNKVSSKVVLSFDLANSKALSDEEKLRIETKLATRLTTEKILILSSGEDRSQLKNKEIVIQRFLELIEKSLVIPKIRKAGKVPKSAVRKRLHDKKNTAQNKQFRKRPDLGGMSSDD
jgi:ribosome-associated protein